ncbi:Glycosyl hydrolase family 76 domain containing protein [Rhypophila sp. PSN 637]
MALSVFLAGILAVANVANVAAIELDVRNTDSIKSAAKTIVQDMVKTYYPADATVGLVKHPLYDDEDPFDLRESAMFWDSLLNYWFLTGDDQYNDKVTKGILGRIGEDRDFFPRDLWDRTNNDDLAAWGLVSLAAAERQLPNPPAGQPKWLDLAKTVFENQSAGWDTNECDGGIRGSKYAAFGGYYYNKFAGSRFLLLAARLGAYTGNQTYLDWAEKQYSWAAGSAGLVTADFAVNYGVSLTGGNCNPPVKFEHTYNQAAYLYGSAVAYNATSSEVWRQRVEGHLKHFANFFVHKSDKVNTTDSAGGKILTEQTCAQITTVCSREERYFKSLTARWMSQAAVAAPFISQTISSYLQESAALAAETCTGKEAGKMCSMWWETGKYVSDATTGLAEEISALEIIQQTLNGPEFKLATVDSSASSPNIKNSPDHSSPGTPSGTGDSGSGNGSGSGSGNGNGDNTSESDKPKDNAAGGLGSSKWSGVIAFVTISQLFM